MKNAKNYFDMKDAYKFLQKIDAMLEKERGFKSEKMDSFICFGGNTEGSANLISGQPGMLHAILVNEMAKEEAIARIILMAAASYQSIMDEQKKTKKIKS